MVIREPVAVCGDGKRTHDEVCDDGNARTESAVDCAHGETCQFCREDCRGFVTVTPHCGDGEVSGPELCDAAFDYCQPGCDAVVPRIVAGGTHSCALSAQGAVSCWGGDAFGTLGDGAPLQDRAWAEPVPGLESGVASISTTLEHVCVLMLSGAVKCWGSDDSGQLGDGGGPGAPASPVPVDVFGLSGGVVSIAAGDYFSCAVMLDGGLRCWGALDPPAESYVPRQLVGVSRARSVSGGIGVCVLRDNGIVACGYDDPLLPVPGLDGVVSVAGAYHNWCALLDTGGVTCWRGDDGNPVAVEGLPSAATAIAVGAGDACALVDGGGVMCWGSDSSGQLGDGPTLADRASAVGVPGLGSGVVAIGAGSAHTCALLDTGAAKCWGANWNGGLGDNGDNSDSPVPVDVVGLP